MSVADEAAAFLTVYSTEDSLHDAADEVGAAWDELAIAIGRALEDWGDAAERIHRAQVRVGLAEIRARVEVSAALAMLEERE